MKLYTTYTTNPVGAAAGWNLLTWFFKIQVKRSQPAAAPTGFTAPEEIQEQQALRVIQANTPVTLIEHLRQQVESRDDLAEFGGEAQVAALLRDFIGEQQRLAFLVLALARIHVAFSMLRAALWTKVGLIASVM